MVTSDPGPLPLAGGRCFFLTIPREGIIFFYMQRISTIIISIIETSKGGFRAA
jgi:hypothetical protein